MSFGVSISDLFAIIRLARTTWRRCHDAANEFGEATRELSSLHTVLSVVREDARNPHSAFSQLDPDRRQAILQVVANCGEAVRELECLLTRYERLGRRDRRTWDALKFGSEPLSDIRSKLVMHLSSLNVLLTSLPGSVIGRIERKLDDIAADLRQGRREPSVLSTYEEKDADIWDVLRKELLDDGITSQDIEQHKDEIKAYIKTLLDSGALDEVDSFESASTVTAPTDRQTYQATCGGDIEASSDRLTRSTHPDDEEIFLQPSFGACGVIRDIETESQGLPTDASANAVDELYRKTSCTYSKSGPSEEELMLTLFLLDSTYQLGICSQCLKMRCNCKREKGSNDPGNAQLSTSPDTQPLSTSNPSSSSSSRSSMVSLSQTSGSGDEKTEISIVPEHQSSKKSREFPEYNIAHTVEHGRTRSTSESEEVLSMKEHNQMPSQICSTCEGSWLTCDCNLRRLAYWNQRTERFLYPLYMFWGAAPYLDKEGRWLTILKYLKRALNTNLPEDFPPFMPTARYAEIVNNVPLWLFQLPRQPQFTLEYAQKIYNGGWTRSYNPENACELLYTNMLAESGERMSFRRCPILDPYTKFTFPHGWIRKVTNGGRIYFQHSLTGFAMHQHPSNSAQVNQQTGWPCVLEHRDVRQRSSLGIVGRWILDDPEAPCLLSREFFRYNSRGRLEMHESKLRLLHFYDKDVPRNRVDSNETSWKAICPEVHWVFDATQPCEACNSMKKSKELDYLLDWRLHNTFQDT